MEINSAESGVIKVCPRCGNTLICFADSNLQLCSCADIKLSAKQKKYIKENFSGCLCKNCLLFIKKNIKD